MRTVRGATCLSMVTMGLTPPTPHGGITPGAKVIGDPVIVNEIYIRVRSVPTP